MPAQTRRNVRCSDGCISFDLPSWKHFYSFVLDELASWAFVYRGQRDSTWKLAPSIDRLDNPHPEFNDQRHLTLFKQATRGRRGQHPRVLTEENDWWALGQHYGLATPLLDWASSAFVAAFFAFVDPAGPGSNVSRRAIWALGEDDVTKKSTVMAQQHNGLGRPPVVEFIRPYSDENPRLISQGGLFTRAPDGVDIESWVRRSFSGSDTWVLVKMTVPEENRESCLRDLNAMNINPMTLFGDLEGASQYCNLAATIDRYESAG